MINIDTLPKSIKYNEHVYLLSLHITAWNKICVCYKYAFGPMSAAEKNIEYNILSNVVESDMKVEDIRVIEKSSSVEEIFDVPDTSFAFDYLDVRLKKALREKTVELYK